MFYSYINKINKSLGHIIMLHKVRPQVNKVRIWANSYLEITPEYLNNLLKEYVAAGYQFISLDDLTYHSYDKKKPFVIITLDDGYKDNYDFAFPIFIRHNVKFTIYVTTSFPNMQCVLWWDDLEDYILNNSSITLNIKGAAQNYQIETQIQKDNIFKELHHLSIEMGLNNWIHTFYEHLNIDPYAKVKQEALTWSHLVELEKHPLCTIAAHTVTHRMLASITDSEGFEEIHQSKVILENKLQTSIVHFAFPFGGVNEYKNINIEQAKKIGIKTCTTTITNNIENANINNLHELPRIAIGMSMGVLKRKVLYSSLYPYFR